MGLFDLFSRDKISLKLTLPKGVRVEHLNDKLKFIGTTGEISKFAYEIRKVAELNDGALTKIDKYIFKVSETMSEDRFRKDWIELPAQAWGVMSSKFLEVVHRMEDNPFYFNSCGFTNKTPLDIGVEVTDLAKTE